MANDQDLIVDLQRRVADLTARVYNLETKLGTQAPLRTPTPKPEGAPAPAGAVASGAAAPPLGVPPQTVTSPAFRTVAPPRSSADLESKIGAQLLNRIGIVAVLIGVSFFLKFAFENNWIGAQGRVAIGLLAGIGVVFWSEYFRNRGHAAFSYSLKAVGIGTLYLSLWGAFHVYKLIPAEVAFIAMLLVTAFTVIMAWAQDAEVLAAYAVAGGFATPLLLSTGENHEVFLFNYVLILNIGTLALIALKPWKRLLAGTFLGTLLMYAGWYSQFYQPDAQNVTVAFASLFFLIFAVAPLVSKEKLSESTKMQGQISATLVGLAFFNAVAYFFELFEIFAHSKETIAFIAVGIAALYLVLGRELQRRVPPEAKQTAGSTLPLIYIALAVGFLTIAVPLKLNAHWITLGWIVEAAVLMYISERAQSALLRVLGAGALVLALFRLVTDMDDFHPHHVLFNARFVTYLAAITVLGWMAYYSAKRPDYRPALAISIIAINILALMAGTYEISDAFNPTMPANYNEYAQIQAWQNWQNMRVARDFSFSAFWMLYGAALMGVGFWKKSAFLRWQGLVLLAFVTLKVMIHDMGSLDKIYRILSAIVLGVLLLAISFVYQRKKQNERPPEPSNPTGAAQ